MAATIETHVVIDSTRNLALVIHIDGDAGGDVSDVVIIDASSFTPAFTECKIMEVEVHLAGFTADFHWDADVNHHAFVGVDGEAHHTWRRMGGLVNDSGTGQTGDLLISTSGLTTNKYGDIIIYMKKKNNV